MPNDWRRTFVGDLAAPIPNALVGGPFGSNLVSSDYTSHGVPVVRGQNMGERWIGGDFAYVTREKAEDLRANLARPGDIVFTQRGTLGQVALVPDGPFDRYLISQSQMKLSVDRAKADALFLYYVFCSPEHQAYIHQFAIQTGVPHTNLGILRSTPIVLPQLSEQTAIARILGTLDDKIELNRRVSETLEQMAQTVFKSWFVALDPPHVSGDELIQERILEIGDGYRAKNEELGEAGLPFIRAADLKNGFDTEGADLLSDASVARAGNKISRIGDVAFTSKGTIGRFARVGEWTARFVYSPQVCFWRSLNSQQLHPALLYCWMQSDDFVDQVMAVAGQTDMAPYVSLRDQRMMKVPVFPLSQAEVGAKIEPLLARQSLALAESQTLAKLRDTLLPKLISGVLRVRDAGRLIEASSS